MQACRAMTVSIELGGPLGRLSPVLQGALNAWARHRSTEAVRSVFETPSARSTVFASHDVLTKAVLDCADAAAFGEGHHAYLTARNLTTCLEQSGALDAIPGLRTALELMRSRSAMFLDPEALRAYFADSSRSPWTQATGVVLLAEQERRTLTNEETTRCFALLPPSEHEELRRWMFFVQGNLLFHTMRASLHKALGTPARPDTPLRFAPAPAGARVVATLEAAYAANRVPVIAFDAYDLDWAAVKRCLAGKPAMFLFRDGASLGHALQFPELFESLFDPQHVVYALQGFPEELLREQPPLGTWSAPRPQGELFALVRLDDARAHHDRLERTVELLEQWLRAREGGVEGAAPAAAWLYRYALALQDELAIERLGGSRVFAYLNGTSARAWRSPHKGLPPAEAHADLAFPDHVEARLLPHRTVRAPRPARAKRPLRLAHVVPQIVDGGHAPSRLLRTLMDHHDRSRFEPAVFVTERLVMRTGDYPMSEFSSAPSSNRGAATIAYLEARGFRVHVDDGSVGFEKSGERLAAKLAEAEVDVAVFHGPDFINLVAAQRTDVPFRVFFEHGTLPNHAGFELVLASTEDSAMLFRQEFARRGARIVAHPFYVNCRENWKAEPYPHSYFRVPDDAHLMTTVTNHLEARCSDDMVWAIAEILNRNPRAWYLPIGRIQDPAGLARRFEAAGAPNRIRFLGSSAEPSQLARSMKLFLNEFPFGSCLGMLDAMASGCVPVSMYDPSGPVQARYGGMFMGLEQVVTSLKRDDYVELACDLLTDETKYAEWSARARESYESRTDLADYVRRLETLLDELVVSAPAR